MATNKRKTNGNPRGRPPQKARLTGVAKVGYQISRSQRQGRTKQESSTHLHFKNTL